MVRQVHGNAVESIGDRRARRTTSRVIGPKHEVIDQELGAALEQVGKRSVSFIGGEPVGLVDAHPGQRLALPRQFVAATGQFLLGGEEIKSCSQPFVSCSGHVGRHGWFLWTVLVGRTSPDAEAVTTAAIHSTTSVRKLGERIVQSTMAVTFWLQRTGLSAGDRLVP